MSTESLVVEDPEEAARLRAIEKQEAAVRLCLDAIADGDVQRLRKHIQSITPEHQCRLLQAHTELQQKKTASSHGDPSFDNTSQILSIIVKHFTDDT